MLSVGDGRADLQKYLQTDARTQGIIETASQEKIRGKLNALFSIVSEDVLSLFLLTTFF